MHRFMSCQIEIELHHHEDCGNTVLLAKYLTLFVSVSARIHHMRNACLACLYTTRSIAKIVGTFEPIKTQHMSGGSTLTV
jgi:hypothetical protein